MSVLRQSLHAPVSMPVKCDYCGRVEQLCASNCAACGGPLPIAEVSEVVVEREYRVTRDVIDVTCLGDANRVFIMGIADQRISERVIRRERVG